ncbi:MAG: ATP-binding protein [Bacteroidales bacterium]|nr:ATP-binding protein [Bacteroidales bacterium]
MKPNTEINPFIVGKYVSDEYFCDRKQETEFLIKQIRNGRNTAVISPRRLGKTGLIKHCFNQKEILENYHTFFVDIYATSSLSEFVYLMSRTIFEQLKPKSVKRKENFFNIIKSLRIGFKIDVISGQPSLDIGLADIQSPQTTIDEIFQYLEQVDKPCIVAIDEFQQVSQYYENNIEALLRTKIQQCKQTSFIFSGSKRHLMTNMFSSASKPFYQSAVIMGLEPIPMETYCDFAVSLFEKNSKHCEREVVQRVYNDFDGYTWFVQMMMNELFALTKEGETCKEDMIVTAQQNVIQIQQHSYMYILANMSVKQKLVLTAIAKEQTAKNITSSEFIKKHKLSSASSVQAAVKALLNNDIITQQDNIYRVYDYFFANWLRGEL